MKKGFVVVEEMFAFVVVDEDGDEGICGFQNPQTGEWMPMVGADIARVDSLLPIARQISKATGKEIRLLRFKTREELEVIK